MYIVDLCCAFGNSGVIEISSSTVYTSKRFQMISWTLDAEVRRHAEYNRVSATAIPVTGNAIVSIEFIGYIHHENYHVGSVNVG